VSDRIFKRLAHAIREEIPVAVATRLDPAGRGAKLLVDAEGVLGELGTPGLNAAVASEARALLSSAQTSRRGFGFDGEPTGTEVDVFIQTFAPKPDMYVFGAIDFSRAMATLGKYLGYRITVVDARPVFATKQRIPDADEIVVAWPDEFLEGARVTASTALIVLTHDVKFDVPLLRVALGTPAGFIGVMGSRRTHANRVEALRAEGFDEAALARLAAPVGLDIGARTPEETAVSIAAEIIALRSGRAGGRLRESSLPVHTPAPPPATAVAQKVS
jgi:xanthine dehydrogenase accessory factor